MNRENLQILANHLLNGSLFQSEFDFSKYRCGTAGCAIGECGRLFDAPELEDLLQEFSLVTPGFGATAAIGEQLEAWGRKKFEINEDTYMYLFVPCTFSMRCWLTKAATAHDVGRLILHYLETGKRLKRSDEEYTWIRRGRISGLNNNPYKAPQEFHE